MPSTRVVFFRHAQSEFNARHLIQGQLDPPNSTKPDSNKSRARRRELPLRTTDAVAVFSSDLRRASVTGRAIADALDLALVEDANLRERHLGDLQGLERASLATSVPSAFKVWKSRDRNAAVPGGGESSAGGGRAIERVFPNSKHGKLRRKEDHRRDARRRARSAVRRRRQPRGKASVPDATRRRKLRRVRRRRL